MKKLLGLAISAFGLMAAKKLVDSAYVKKIPSDCEHPIVWALGGPGNILGVREHGTGVLCFGIKNVDAIEYAFLTECGFGDSVECPKEGALLINHPESDKVAAAINALFV